MWIAVYGGAGTIGSRIVAEAIDRDHQVTVITRTGTADLPAGARARKGDAADADDVAKVASEHDVIVSAIGPSRSGARVEVFLTALRRLAENVGSHRLIVVGGSGLLYVAPGLRLLDTAGFPPAYRHEALAQLAALEQLRDGGGFVDWVYVSPAPVTTPGQRTGQYKIGSDMVLNNHISAEDYAVAILDEIERPRHRREQFAVSAS
jgi:putative NADH-flavin reductase